MEKKKRGLFETIKRKLAVETDYQNCKFEELKSLVLFAVFISGGLHFLYTIFDIIAGQFSIHIWYRLIPVPVMLLLIGMLMRGCKPKHLLTVMYMVLHACCIGLALMMYTCPAEGMISRENIAPIFICNMMMNILPYLAVLCADSNMFAPLHLLCPIICFLCTVSYINDIALVLLSVSLIIVESFAISIFQRVYNKTYYRMYDMKQKLEMKSQTDALTGLYNRQIFEQICDRERKLVPETYGVLMIDVDKFKSVNDTFGHDKGDEILKRIGNVIKDSLRPSDYAIRFGGEEFVVLVRSYSLEACKTVAQRIATNFAEANKVDSICQPTLSIGCALADPNLTIEENIKLADDATYFIKRNGRNGIAVNHDGNISKVNKTNIKFSCI